MIPSIPLSLHVCNNHILVSLYRINSFAVCVMSCLLFESVLTSNEDHRLLTGSVFDMIILTATFRRTSQIRGFRTSDWLLLRWHFNWEFNYHDSSPVIPSFALNWLNGALDSEGNWIEASIWLIFNFILIYFNLFPRIQISRLKSVLRGCMCLF